MLVPVQTFISRNRLPVAIALFFAAFAAGFRVHEGLA